MITEIYEEIKFRNKTLNLFLRAELDIIVNPVYKIKEEGETQYDGYKLSELRLDIPKSLENKAVFIDLRKMVTELNQNIMNNPYDSEKSWSIFYLYKELIQKLVSDRSKGKFNYFRGQINDWNLNPSLFRNDTSQEFIKNFDSIYCDIAREYPENIKYIPYSENSMEARAEQIAMLQHYGMRTSLLDITKNPFIALQFMTLLNDDNEDPRIGTYDMFLIDEVLHSQSNIFTTIVKNSKNIRIKAQKGAFFNFDHIYDIERNKIQPIPMLRIRTVCNTDEFEEKLKNKQKGFLKYKQILEEEPENVKILNKIEANINSLQEKIENDSTKLKKEVSNEISTILKKKLEEYFYLEKNLFPDFDKYISYLQKSNINSVETVNDIENIN